MRNRRQNPSIFLTSLIAVSIMTMLTAMPTGAYGGIFVTNLDSNTVGEYTTSGATVNASLITGLNVPIGIAVTPTSVSVPEPSTFVLMGLGFAVLFVALRRRMNA